MIKYKENPESPLMGLYWNEAEGDNNNFRKGLLTIIAHDLENRPHAIGTGFVIDVNGTQAIAVTAAHVFNEVRRLQTPPSRHSQSALSEFLPPPKAIDIDRKLLRVVCVEEGVVESTIIEWLCFDEDSDIAIFSIALQNRTKRSFFISKFDLDNSIPSIGDLVCILSYGNLDLNSFKQENNEKWSYKLSQRPILRIGTVLNYHPNGTRLCRGACIETSIPVYSGMSGGLVCRYGSVGTAIRAIGLVCSDPDPDTENKENRNIEGRSIIALLPCQIKEEDGKEKVRLKIPINKSNTSGLL